jgi:hypothetical protein
VEVWSLTVVLASVLGKELQLAKLAKVLEIIRHGPASG